VGRLTLALEIGGSGTYNLKGGSLQVGELGEFIGLKGTGTFDQSGGKHTVAGNLFIGSSNGSGTYNSRVAN
jgi:hypothetical protein